MQGRACTESHSTCEDLAASLLSDILLKKRRGVEYQLYPLDYKTGCETIHKREKRLLKSHILALLFKLNALQTRNKKTIINYKQMEVLNHILTLPSTNLMVNKNRIKGAIHINIILQDTTTTYLDSNIIQDNIVLNYDLLDEYAVLPSTDCPDTIQNDSELLAESFNNANGQRVSGVSTEITSAHNERDIATVPNNIPVTPPMYPMLTRFGIPTQYSDPNTAHIINAILKELEQLGKEHKLEVTRDNNTKAALFFIPVRLSSKKSFDNWAKKKTGMNSIFEYISNGNINATTNELTSVGYVCEYIYTHYPRTFVEVVNSNGLTLVNRMNAVETAAILSDVGIADKKLLSTMHRHLKYKLGGDSIFAKKTDLIKLTSRLPLLTSRELEYEKEPGLKTETIGLATVEIGDVIKYDMNRYLETMVSAQQMFNSPPTEPLYQYNIDTDKQGIYVLIGTDHGQGTAQFLVRLNLGTSQQRRDTDRADYNTRTLSYATIKCKKDPYAILQLTSELTKRGINVVQNNQLIAIMDESTNIVRTMWIHQDACNFHIASTTLVAYGPKSIQSFPIPPELQGKTLRYKVIVSKFRFLQVGDLAAQMTLQGREGMASCRCIKCDLTQKEWKTKKTNGRLLTIEQLTAANHDTARLGQKQNMLWTICPTNTVVPILHCEIGTVNDQLFKKLFRLLLSVECGTQEEMDKQTRILEIGEIIKELKTRKEQLESHLDLQLVVNNTRRKELMIRRATSLRRLKAAQKSKKSNSHLRVQENTVELQRINHMICTIDSTKSGIKANINTMISSLQLQTKTINKLHSDVKELAWERRKEEVSIFTKVERILDSYGVKIQLYHGGTLTGVSIIAMLNNHIAIMKDIESVAIDAIENRSQDTQPLRPPTVAAIRTKLDLHRNLFQAQDAVYAHLRLMNPTTVERRETRKRIEVMRELWGKMDLPETPKAHLIFEHAADDQDKFDGLGDKIEDPLEKRHQEQMRFDNILSKMHGGFNARMMTQQKYEWRNNDPMVQAHINRVKVHTSRKRPRHDVSLANCRKHKVKKERQDNRTDNITAIISDSIQK